jgi:hypothetical protein
MKIEDEHEICKTKIQTKFISITYENLNMKWNEQGYGARLHFKLMLNRWKVMGVLFLFVPIYGPNSKVLSWMFSICPQSKEPFLKV